MKKRTIILMIIMLWASLAKAQQAPMAGVPESRDEAWQGQIGLTFTGLSLDGSSRAGEYEFLKPSAGGDLQVEGVSLPHRFSVEAHALNEKDYFSDLDYAYRDVVLFNFLARGVYHNLDHYSFRSNLPATGSPSFVDLNPNDLYGIENSLQKGFIRFKTPDFPFHLYADATTVDRNGSMQQRFMRGYTGGLNMVSRSRKVDWISLETRAGVNSHLGPVEFDYNHAEKKFTVREDKVMNDADALTHNLIPDLTSTTDTVKLHTSLTGRLVASATYAKGKKKNKDSDAKADFNNSAGDLVVTPVAGLAFFLRYRHYELDLDNPDIGKITGAGQSAPWTVRDSISSKKDVMTGAVRYRLTERLTVKGEYAVEAIKRNVEGINSNGYPTQALGELVAAHTVKSTEKLGLTYRVMSKLSLRADYTAVQIENPAYADDPDRIGSAKTTITWTPSRRIIAVASYGGVRENRDKLTAPLAGGSRKTDRQQGLGSLTFVVGKRSSLTASYMNYQNLAKEILTRRDSSGSLFLEDSVPYADRAKVYSLSATQAMSDNVRLVLEASESLSRGNFKTGGELAGIDSYSDMRVVEDIYTAGLEIQHSETISGELRYQQRHYDDRIDNTQDGKVSIIMATMAVKW